MEIINCKDCGIVCIAHPSERCPDCRQQIREAEGRVSEYLAARSQATLGEIQAATGVHRKIIMQMVWSGRTADCVVGYPCENCQELITKARICPRCAEKLSKFLATTME